MFFLLQFFSPSVLLPGGGSRGVNPPVPTYAKICSQLAGGYGFAWGNTAWPKDANCKNLAGNFTILLFQLYIFGRHLGGGYVGILTTGRQKYRMVIPSLSFDCVRTRLKLRGFAGPFLYSGKSKQSPENYTIFTEFIKSSSHLFCCIFRKVSFLFTRLVKTDIIVMGRVS